MQEALSVSVRVSVETEFQGPLCRFVSLRHGSKLLELQVSNCGRLEFCVPQRYSLPIFGMQRQGSICTSINFKF